MLGRSISDPQNIEGNDPFTNALGYLDIATTMKPQKQTSNVDAVIKSNGERVRAYEIHAGDTTGPDTMRPFSNIADGDVLGRNDGAVSANGRISGTYLHGLFANDAYRRAFLQSFGISAGQIDYLAAVDAALDALAHELEACVDIDALFEIAS